MDCGSEGWVGFVRPVEECVLPQLAVTPLEEAVEPVGPVAEGLLLYELFGGVFWL